MGEAEVREEKAIEERKIKIKNWLKEPSNLILVGILIFSFIVLVYYFNLTKTQTSWWDEAEYMATAKHWAFNVPYVINPQRPPLFPFLAFILYKFGFGDLSIKFFLELIPAWLTVLFTYFLVKEMYDKKIALIASFITSVSWIHLFYAMRFMTDSLSLLFGILAFFCFWRGYINNKGKIYIWLIGLFVSLSFMSRLIGVLFGVFILFFLVLTLQFNFLKNKHMWLSFIISLLAIAPYLLWSNSYYGNPLAFRSGYGGIAYPTLGWWMINLVYDYPELGFFVMFLLGLLTLAPMLLSLDKLIVKKDRKYYNDFFMFLLIIFTLAFFIYFLRQGENRWLIMMAVGIFTISAKGILFLYDLVKKNLGKSIAILIVLLLISAGAYFQLKHASMIIKVKIDSYRPVQEAALWMKENSNPEDILATASITQTVFYSERKVISFYNSSANKYYTPDEFFSVVKSLKPKFLVVSVFEPSIPQWTYTFTQGKESIFIPIKAWFADQTQKQPVLIIYYVNQTALL